MQIAAAVLTKYRFRTFFVIGNQIGQPEPLSSFDGRMGPSTGLEDSGLNADRALESERCGGDKSAVGEREALNATRPGGRVTYGGSSSTQR